MCEGTPNAPSAIIRHAESWSCECDVIVDTSPTGRLKKHKNTQEHCVHSGEGDGCHIQSETKPRGRM